MRIISWNINSLNNAFGELKLLINEFRPEIICLQKVRCNSGREKFMLEDFDVLYNGMDGGSWSGVMTYARIRLPMKRITTQTLSAGGHFQAFDCGGYTLANVYVPFANSQIAYAGEYRRSWDFDLRKFIEGVVYDKPVIMCGDFNVVHTALDTFEDRLEQPRPNFSKWERDNFDYLMKNADLVDVCRLQHQNKRAITFYGNYRDTSLGSRIDYILVSRSIANRVKFSDILNDFGTGQSVPILIDIDL